MRKGLKTVVEAATIGLAALVLAYPEWRTGPMKLAVLFLWLVVGASLVRRLHKAGVLDMTPGQIYREKEKPKIELLEYLAVLFGAAVIVFAGR